MRKFTVAAKPENERVWFHTWSPRIDFNNLRVRTNPGYKRPRLQPNGTPRNCGVSGVIENAK
jgi:hypothetical protein